MSRLFLSTTAALALILSANVIQAQTITATGDVSPTPPTPPTWNITDLVVGNTTTGTLTIANGATVNATTSTTIANVAGSVGTLNFGAPAGSPPAPTGTLNTPTVTFGAGTGTINFNHTDTLTVDARILGIGAVNQISGTTILAGVPVTAGEFRGSTITVSGGTLRADTALYQVNVNVESAGTLDLDGMGQLLGNVTNAGLIIGGFTLMGGHYVGQDGTIALNTVLGADDSTTQAVLFIGGTVSGHTFLQINNVGGSGAQTTVDGIQVIRVLTPATTTEDTFTLANPELRAGSYDYMLFRGPLIPCAASSIAPAAGGEPSPCQSWFLRSTFVEEQTPEPPPPVTPPDELPPTPPKPGPGLFPIIGPEIATYGVVQPMAQQLGRAMLGTHDDRFGDLYPVPCEPAAPIYTKAPPLYTKAPSVDCSTGGFRPAVWGRVFGQQVDNHYLAFADPRTDGQIAGLQLGFDVVRSNSLIDGHQDYGGLYFAYGNANVNVTGLVTNPEATAYVLQHTGNVNLNAYSGGAYWTHYGPQGWYVDLVLQGTSYSDAAATEFAHLDTSGTGFISSLETGYPIAVPALGWGFVLEPQAQVLGQWINFDSGNDGLGPVALGRTSETTARLGLKGKWTITTDNGQVWQPYVRANVWSDFGGTAVTMFGPDSVPLISHGQYMDVDAGFTTKIDTHFSAFADAGYQFAVSNDGGGQRNGVKGTAGLHYQW